jgi:hypothetical protein
MSVAAIEWSQGIEDAWSKFATFIPKLIGFLAVLLIGLFIARAMRKVLARLLTKVGADSLVNRSSLGRTLQQAGIGSASSILVKVIYYGLVLLVLQLAIGVLGPNPISNAFSSMMSYIPKIAVAIAIVFITGIIADKVGDIVGSVTARQSYGKIVTNIAVASIWVIGGFAALDQVQVARDVVDTLFRTVVASLGAILVIQFGVGGIWAARDRFWPRVYDALGAQAPKQDGQR